MGLAGAGWTFVKAAALRLLGGLRGASERVQAGARRPRTAWRRLRRLRLASGRKTLGSLLARTVRHHKRACRALWRDLRTQFVVILLSVAVRNQKEHPFGGSHTAAACSPALRGALCSTASTQD